MGTEVNARIRIDDEKKIAAKGALWYEESLPAESILAGLVWCDRAFPRGLLQPPNGKTEEQWLMDTYCQKELTLQIGGKATVGKGRVRCLFTIGEGKTDGHP
ncbi:MAG: RAMP superfamily CRISPR-associated protein [Gammaproteobacteria bacterium]